MSQPSNTERFTPSPRSIPLAAHASHLHEPTSRSSPSRVVGLPQLGLPNKLIPRDYLTFHSKQAPAVDGLVPQSLTSTSAHKDFEHPGGSPRSITEARLGATSTSPKTSLEHPRRQPGNSDKENILTDEGLKVSRTRSPESVETFVPQDGSARIQGSKPLELGSSAIQFNMPRTSSIDSAISSASASSSQNRRPSDTQPPSPDAIRHLISAAGSAENLIAHLLKEKQNAATQNSQLWKLVEKQRTLLMGLNKDLERTTKERDKYKKRLREIQGKSMLPPKSPKSPTAADAGSKGFPAVQQPNHMAVSQDQADMTLEDRTAAGHRETSHSPIEGDDSLMSGPGPAVIITDDLEEAYVTSSQPHKPQTPDFARTSFTVTEATPLSAKTGHGSMSSRKAPPKPLNLSYMKGDQTYYPSALQSVDSAPPSAPLQEEDGEDVARGRRKTREEDDRDREVAAIKEEEARSRSKKSKQPKPVASEEAKEHAAVPKPTLPASPRPQIQSFPPPANIASMAATLAAEPTTQSSLGERLTAPIRSPGLPASPRPMHQTFAGMNSLPMSPRANNATFLLSPRAPKTPLPQPTMATPFTDPAMAQKQNNMVRQAQMQSHQPSDRLQVHEPAHSNEIPPVYRGLRDPAYPNLLLPPNALPSVQVKVASSRLQPPRQGMTGIKYEEQNGVFSLSIYSRASRNELWRIEKHPASLAQLEQQLKPRCQSLPKLPDRKVFIGQAPTTVDLRRKAIDEYWDELLDVQVDEQSAIIICRYLSSDVLDPEDEAKKFPGVNQESLPQTTSLSGKIVKTGFLTKKGKNFGGWKSRYFILDSPELRYYETPGGPQIGTIKISHARIGSQKNDDTTSADVDDIYRHAFLIQEPKKKDSTTFVRHVLCAESDDERDEWVSALLHYVEGGAREMEVSASPVSATAPGKSGNAFPSPNLSGPALRDKGAMAEDPPSKSSSPTSTSSYGDSALNDHAPAPLAISRNTNISGPMNGAPISNSAHWGNKPAHSSSIKDKNHKMPNLFHFKKTSQEQISAGTKQAEQAPAKPRILRHNGYVRAVFGLPLAEAVEFCAPFNVDVELPAVVYRSIEYLQHRKAANEEGLFRLSGSNTVVKSLKERFNTEGDVDLVADEEYHDVHAIASLFKTYLRELPSTILTRDLHLEFLKVLEMDTQQKKVVAFNILVHRLPSVNFSLLRALSQYLLEVTDNSDKNKMSVKNIGIVFSPTLNIPTPVFTLFLTEFSAIFEQTPNQTNGGSIQNVEVRAPSNLAPVDIRSPRQQMFSDALPTPAYNQTRFAESSGPSISGPGAIAPSAGEFGMVPIHPSYENGNYVSMLHGTRFPQAPGQQIQQDPADNDGQQFGSLNRILVPDDNRSAKQKRRESAMFY